MYLISAHLSFAKLSINCFFVINLYVYVFFLGFCSCVFSVFVPSVFGFVSSRETPALPFGVTLSFLTNQINNNNN